MSEIEENNSLTSEEFVMATLIQLTTDVNDFIDHYQHCFWCKSKMENITTFQNAFFTTKAFCQSCQVFYQFNFSLDNTWQLIMVLEENISINTTFNPQFIFPECFLINNKTGVGVNTVNFERDILNGNKANIIEKRNNLLYLGELE